MNNILGVRREDKNIWERRVPIIPSQVKELSKNENIKTIIQPYPNRAIPDTDFTESGAVINENLSKASTIIGVKEIPINLLLEKKKYLFFSHTIKGQKYNMPLLKKMIELKCTLIDYECIKESSGRRLVYFGRFAGISGMLNTFHAIGKRCNYLGCNNPFEKIKSAYKYGTLENAGIAVKELANEISTNSLDSAISPLVIGFVGYGNVSNGAQEIFDILPHIEITPKELLETDLENGKIYKVVFKEIDIVEPIAKDYKFELIDYFNNPQKYKSKFEIYLNKIDVLINAIYWDTPYPKLLSKKYIKENFNNVKLKIVTDISCDIGGSVEFTQKVMKPDLPAYVYNPLDDSCKDGFEGEGIVDITVDNLPTELPKDSSESFSKKLFPFLANIVKSSTDVPFEENEFVEEIKHAVILYNGKFTPNFKYMEAFLVSK